ncbi:MAG TPA: Ig-like domain-containing protein [Terriglobales bacterium]|nr:Ig-like domain-containing protein [Terriglobales bacterium]
MKNVVRLLCVITSLAAISSAGVTISSPTSGSSLGSPVHVVASASSTHPITFMRVYVDNVSVYGVAAAKVDTSIGMSTGQHSVVVQSWDSAGTVAKTGETINVSAPAPTPTPTPAPTHGVTISSPSNGATVPSPVHVVASASSAAPVTFMRIYVDGVSVFGIAASRIDTSLAMAAGRHNIVVQSWDSAGTVLKSGVAITVSTSSPTPTPTPTPNPGLPAPPSTAVTISNIDQLTGWSSCTACAGAGGAGPVSKISMTENLASPSIDGKSAKFSLTPSSPYSDALWWKQLGAVNNATNLKYDLYFYLTNPQAAQALEFDANQANGKMRWIYGTQCNIKTANGGHWDVWGNAQGNWLSTGIPCGMPTAFTWHHLTWEFKRTATTLTFIGFTYDGVTHYINKTYTGRASGVNELNIAFQMDAGKLMQGYSSWLDKISLTYW